MILNGVILPSPPSFNKKIYSHNTINNDDDNNTNKHRDNDKIIKSNSIDNLEIKLYKKRIYDENKGFVYLEENEDTLEDKRSVITND